MNKPKATHTPGPWEISGGYLVGLADPEYTDTIAIFDDCCGPSDVNKALIQAAPELLAAIGEGIDALRDIINAADNGQPYTAEELKSASCAFCAALGQMRAAQDKARGEST